MLARPGASILLVEDNPDDVALTLRALKRVGVAVPVTVANDGVEALDHLLGEGSRAGSPALSPTLVLLDLKLPRLDGLELLARLRADARTRLVRVVVLTTSENPPDVQRAYELGASAFVRKPVDSDRFVAALGALAAFWLEHNLPPAPGAPS